jgi:dTMP kinase
MDGKFIVLEGIDGAGTTSQIDRVVRFLAALGRPAVATREPSDGPIGRLIREILLGKHATPAGAKVSGETMALLFAADRTDHLHREILPHLQAGVDVVSDRYHLSSLADQAEESDIEWVGGLARGIRRPDLTIVFDLPVSVAFKRRQAAGRPIERYDADTILEKVRLNYLRLANAYPPTVTIDASQGMDEVTQALGALISRHFGWPSPT